MPEHSKSPSYSPSSSKSSSPKSNNESNNAMPEPSIPTYRQINRERHASSTSTSGSSDRYRSPTGSDPAANPQSHSTHRNWRQVEQAANRTDPHGHNTPGMIMTVSLGPRPSHEDPNSSSYEYGPTRLPPVPYQGASPFTGPPTGRRPGVPSSAVDFLPQLEQRVASVERAVDGYMHVRANEALERSSLEALQRQAQHRPRNPSSNSNNSHSYNNSGGSSSSGHYSSNQNNQYYYR